MLVLIKVCKYKMPSILMVQQISRLTLCMLGNFSCFCCLLATFIRVSNGLDPDQDRRSVGPDLGSNCL